MIETNAKRIGRDDFSVCNVFCFDNKRLLYIHIDIVQQTLYLLSVFYILSSTLCTDIYAGIWRLTVHNKISILSIFRVYFIFRILQFALIFILLFDV